MKQITFKKNEKKEVEIMNPEHVRRILGKFNKKETLRLADLSGDVFWHKNHKMNAKKTEPLNLNYETEINYRQMNIFKTAKELASRSILVIVYEKGENWFIKNYDDSQFPYLTYLGNN
jgi:hypothetical protein